MAEPLNLKLLEPPAPFVGREKELVEIKRLLLEEPACRLLTLVGPDGIGKSRLASKAALAARDAFPHGVYFISPAAIHNPQAMASTIARAIKLTFFGRVDPVTQLLNYLRPKKLLLVLDTVEHLPDPSAGAKYQLNNWWVSCQ